MASIETISKAKLYSMGLQRFFNAKPSLDIQQDHVRVFFPDNELTKAQNQFSAIMTAEPSDVRIDMGNALMPGLIKKYGMYLVGFLIGGVLLGRQMG